MFRRIAFGPFDDGQFFAAPAAGFLPDLLPGGPERLCHPVRLIGECMARMEKRLQKRGGNL